MARQKFTRRAQLLLAIVESGRQRLTSLCGGDRHLGLGDPRGAGAQHDGDAIRPQPGFELIEPWPDLGKGRQQQPIVARVIGRERRRHWGQRRAHPADRGEPAIAQGLRLRIQWADALPLPAGQGRRHRRLALPQGADQAVVPDVAGGNRRAILPIQAHGANFSICNW
ncbi:hypothetical protein D3C80_1479330 [compost metagenome]